MKKIFFFICLASLVMNVSWASAKNTYLVKIPQTEINERLNKGEGGIVIGYEGRMMKKEVNPGSFNNLQDLIAQGCEPMEEIRNTGTTVLVLPPGEKKKEVKIQYNRDLKNFIFMGQPGEYTISQIFYVDFKLQYWKRVWMKVNIEPGVIKYVGDVMYFGSSWKPQFLKRQEFYKSFVVLGYNPQNVSPELIKILKEGGREIVLSPPKTDQK